MACKLVVEEASSSDRTEEWKQMKRKWLDWGDRGLEAILWRLWSQVKGTALSKFENSVEVQISLNDLCAIILISVLLSNNSYQLSS